MKSHRFGFSSVVLVSALCLTVATACSARGGSSTSSPGGAVSSAPTTGSATPKVDASIPAKYQDLYANLGADLDAYQSAVDAMPDASKGAAQVVAAAELLPANGNRLDQLLAPATLSAVDAWLDRFHGLGIMGVTLGVKLPMLLPSFSPNSEAYTTFFATVADHARSRGMTVDVELGALFCDTVFASCTKPFDGNYAHFVDATVTEARVVIDRVRPNYLTILAEPTTEAALTGVRELLTPEGSARYVHDVLAGIGDRGSTKVGAGAASWMPSTYDQAILKEAVDYLDLHTYPMTPQIAATIVADTALARQAGKPIVADEVGLYKTDNPSPAGAATADTVYRLDNFAFFEPLDVRFLTITAAWAKKAGVAYASFYWAGQLFAYLPWTPDLDGLPYQSLTQQANQAITKAFQAGVLSALGRTWPAVTLR